MLDSLSKQDLFKVMGKLELERFFPAYVTKFQALCDHVADLIAQAMYWCGDCSLTGKNYIDAYRMFKKLTWDYPESTWAKYARGRLAEAKARAAAEAAVGGAAAGSAAAEDWVVVGADTIVSLDRVILGKPSGPEEAARMLERLSGRIHEVWTGLFLLDQAGARTIGGALRSIVKFATLGPDDVARYVATGEPLDKAGAYAVQGKGAVFVEAIEGSYSNVVGLPLSYLKHLLELLRQPRTEHV